MGSMTTDPGAELGENASLQTQAAEAPAMTVRAKWRAVVNELFENEGLSTVFSHARNVLTGTAVVAAGMYAAQHVNTGHLQGMWTVQFAGYVVAFLGTLLLVLNLVDVLRRLARRRHHLLLRLLAILVYVALSVRLTQVVIYFRAAG